VTAYAKPALRRMVVKNLDPADTTLEDKLQYPSTDVDTFNMVFCGHDLQHPEFNHVISSGCSSRS